MEISEHIERDYTKVIGNKNNRNELIKNQNSYYDGKVKEIEEMFKEIIKIRNKYS
jgi:hypothetical protein